MGKDSISWTEQVFCIAVLLTLIRIDGVSYLNGYCSLMFLRMFLYVFYKSEKHAFYVFYLQINVLTLMNDGISQTFTAGVCTWVAFGRSVSRY